MSNSYFQFKQFRIEQSACAMKVSTDACIQGAWTPINKKVKQVLDIGTGTGLLSLMLAQRNDGIRIDAIELEEQAALQAAANFKASPWSDRLHAIHGDAKTHCFNKKYDLIICNPPFFKNSLLGDNAKRNHARHTIHLSLEELMKIIAENLAADGYASVLLPVTEQEAWAKLLYREGYYVSRLDIHPADQKPANRVVTLSSKIDMQIPAADLTIRTTDASYSHDFFLLMQPFYLNL